MTHPTPRSMLALLALAALALPAAAAAQAVTRSHPLPVDLDDRTAPGQLWIRFTETVYEEPFEAFARRTPDPAARAFVETVRALARKDAEAARPRLVLRHGAPLATLVDVIHGAFNRFEDLTVINRVAVGERQVFYLRLPGADGRPVTQGMWFAPVGDTWKGWIVESPDPAELLIREALDATAREPSRFAPVTEAPAGFRFPADTADGAAARVWVEMAGTLADFDAYDPAQAPFSPASALFRQAMLELTRSDWAAFQQHFTPRSAERIGQWVAAQPPEVLDTAKSMPALSLRVLLEIPLADGGAWLYYSQGMGPEHADDPVRVARAAGDGRGGLWLSSYKKRDLVLKSIARLPGFPDQRGPFLAFMQKHRVGGTR